jgi:invasion protein IalB
MRFFLSFLFALLLISTGIAVVTISSAEQGGWSLNLPIPQLSSDAPAGTPSIATGTTTGEAAPPQAAAPQAAPEASAAPPGKLVGEPIGDWLFNCSASPKTSVKRCSIRQQLSDQKSKSVVFAWLIGDDGKGNLVGVWQTPTGVLINRGVLLDVGTDKPIAVPFTACITGHCEAVANLAPDFVETLIKAEKATATIFAVSGQGLTFNLSVKGLSDGIAALKKATADG